MINRLKAERFKFHRNLVFYMVATVLFVIGFISITAFIIFTLKKAAVSVPAAVFLHLSHAILYVTLRTAKFSRYPAFALTAV